VKAVWTMRDRITDFVVILYEVVIVSRYTGIEKGVRVWHVMSRTVDNIDSSFLYGFYLIALTVRE